MQDSEAGAASTLRTCGKCYYFQFRVQLPLTWEGRCSFKGIGRNRDSVACQCYKEETIT